MVIVFAVAALAIAAFAFSRKRWGTGTFWAVLGVIVLYVVLAPTGNDATTASQPAAQEASQADFATDTPVSRPKNRQQEKREFLKTVDESISGARIAGNPFKFVGRHVDLHCTISSIPQDGYLNADCGSAYDPVNIVIHADTHQLESGQRIRVLGTVEKPEEGTNAMGGSMAFPTVTAQFME